MDIPVIVSTGRFRVGGFPVIKTEQLFYLTKIAQCSSMNQAAEQLYMTRAALSASVKQLESECGYLILERNSRGVKLTEKGKHVLSVAEQVLALCNDLIEDTKDVDLTAGLASKKCQLFFCDCRRFV